MCKNTTFFNNFPNFAKPINNKAVQFSFLYNSLSFIALVVFGICLLVQFIYHWGVFSNVAFYKNRHQPKFDSELEPVSIVLCARDVYDHLVELVPALLQQNYPNFEVVIVNDCSDDETEDYLKELERRDPRVRPVHLKQHLNFFNGKKFPLSMGIKSAQNDLIVLTDCDCMPSNNEWLRSVVNCYGRDTEMVIGYSPYARRKGFLNHLIRFDAVQNAFLYLSAALRGRPYMGIGKNLSYRKELFYRNKGFISHYTTPVGDDDLFVSQAATSRNTEVLIDAENTIITTPISNFTKWCRQRCGRHSTTRFYDASDRLRLSLFYASQLLFHISFILLLCLAPAFVITGGEVFYIPIIVFLFLLRFGSQIILYHQASKRLGEKGLVPTLILCDFISAFLTPLLRLMGRMKVGTD